MQGGRKALAWQIALPISALRGTGPKHWGGVQAKLAGLQEELAMAREAEEAALRHWDVEREAVKATLQQLEDMQVRSKQQNLGLAQAHAQAAVSSLTPLYRTHIPNDITYYFLNQHLHKMYENPATAAVLAAAAAHSVQHKKQACVPLVDKIAPCPCSGARLLVVQQVSLAPGASDHGIVHASGRSGPT